MATPSASQCDDLTLVANPLAPHLTSPRKRGEEAATRRLEPITSVNPVAANGESARAPKIAIFTDKLDWHVEHLAGAFARAGALAKPVRLAGCKIDTTRPHGLAIPGFNGSLPCAGVVRAIGDGSLEMITMRLGVLHALGERGVPLVNSARAIERCTDKSMASFLLAEAKIPTPATFVTGSLAEARRIARRECAQGPLVLKPLFGAQGWGLKLIRNEDDLPSPQTAAGVYYLQRFIAPKGATFEDKRILVSQGKVVAAMLRRSPHWVTNVGQGAKPFAVEPAPTERDIALRAAAALGADFAGIDVITGPEGAPMVLEVNSMAGWSGLQSITGFSIAERLAEDVLATIPGLRRAHG